MNNAELEDRATKARAILDSPLYQEAYESVRSALLSIIEGAKLSDVQSAEDARKCLKLLRDVRANLDAAVSQGKIASFQRAEDEKRRNNPLRYLFR